jgi:hypothetical protein
LLELSNTFLDTSKISLAKIKQVKTPQKGLLAKNQQATLYKFILKTCGV